MPATSMQPDFGPTTQQFDTAIGREALPAGSRVGGYQIVDVLGGGGFGIVYLALDLSLQRQVAIKEYLPTDLASRGPTRKLSLRPGADAPTYAAGLSAFLNEAKQLARFDHPSLVRVYSFWEENGTAYMVMPFYPGHTLATELRALNHPPDESWLRALLAPLLSVLATLHAASTWHRDISPENILVQPDGRPVLLDFGAASRAARDKTVPLTALLNPAFAPIEQYSESPELRQGPWTDLYALASVIHLAIVGKPPMSATVRAVEDRQPPLAEAVRPLQIAYPALRYSAGFLAAIDRALSVHPRDRPQNVAEFQAALDKPQAGVHEDDDGVHDDVRAAIATALRSVPGQPRAEPAFRMPDLDTGGFGETPPSAAYAQRRPGGLRRAMPWLLLLGAAVLAAGAWQWSRTPQGAHLLEALSGGEPEAPRTFQPAPVARAAPQGDTVAAAPPAAPLAAPSEAASAEALTVAAAPAASAAMPPVRAAQGLQPPVQQEVMTSPAEPEPETAQARAMAAPVAQTAPGGQAGKKSAEKKAAEKKAAEKAPEAAEPNNPRALCGARSNFALYYCMQTECKRPKFTQHAQCVELRRRGEVN